MSPPSGSLRATRGAPTGHLVEGCRPSDNRTADACRSGPGARPDDWVAPQVHTGVIPFPSQLLRPDGG
jgi:hypothetical protein